MTKQKHPCTNCKETPCEHARDNANCGQRCKCKQISMFAEENHEQLGICDLEVEE